MSDKTPAVLDDGLWTLRRLTAARIGLQRTGASLATGPLLDGFSIAATNGHGSPYLAWDTKDPNAMTVSSLTVKKQ